MGIIGVPLTGQVRLAVDTGCRVAGVVRLALTLRPTAAGRTYAAYGEMYIAVALVWLHFIDGVALTRWDVAGASIALAGMAVIALQPSTAG